MDALAKLAPGRAVEADPIKAALAYAAELDALAISLDWDADAERGYPVDTALRDVADLSGRNFCGFASGLRAAIDRIEDDCFEDESNDSEWSSGSRDGGQSAFVSPWLERDIEERQRGFAEAWLEKARAIMASAKEV